MINAKTAALLTMAALTFGGCQATNGVHTHITRSGDDIPYHQHPHQTWWHYKFVYYPHEQVYFEPYTKMYYWFANGQWEQGSVLPETISLDAHDARMVRLKYEQPYVQHLSVLRWQFPFSIPLPGSTEDFHTSPEGIAMTQQRWSDRAGMTEQVDPTFGEGFFANGAARTETGSTANSTMFVEVSEDSMDDDDFGFEPMELDDPLFTTADPGLETGGLDP